MIPRITLTLLAALTLLFGVPAEGERHGSPKPMSPRHRAEAVQVGNPEVGKQLFEMKRCVTCHAIKGTGGSVGPDLGKLQHTHNIYQMAAIMWNHSAKMGQVMEEKGIKRPEFKGDEFAHLLAYLHSLPVVGDPQRGRVVFEQKGCVKCHAIRGEGGKFGPELARTMHPHPPIELVGIMWNHSPTMTAMMGALGIVRPVFDGTEMADLLAYLNAAQREAATDPPDERRHQGH